MPRFKCTVTDTSGNVIKRNLSSSSQSRLIGDLKRDGLIPVEIQEVDEKRGKRYSGKILSDFTSSLSLMMDSGLTLKDSLSMSRKTLTNKHSLTLTATLNEKLEKGLTFHGALKDSCSNLPPLFLGLVKIGERIGSLKDVFRQLKSYMEEQKKFRDMMIGSLIYPVFVLCMVLIATILAAIFVIPGIQEILGQFGSASAELEEMTQKISRFRSVTLALIPALLILTILSVILKRVSRVFSNFLDRAVINIPVIKGVITDQSLYNVMYSMELLTNSGIPLEEAIKETTDVVHNNEIKADLLRIRDKILKGEKLSEAFLASSVFPDRVGQWIGFGESTGKVEQIFGQLKDYYRNIIEKRLKLFMTMVEPAMIILIGIIILVFVLNLVVPILTLYGSVL